MRARRFTRVTKESAYEAGFMEGCKRALSAIMPVAIVEGGPRLAAVVQESWNGIIVPDRMPRRRRRTA